MYNFVEVAIKKCSKTRANPARTPRRAAAPRGNSKKTRARAPAPRRARAARRGTGAARITAMQNSTNILLLSSKNILFEGF